MDVKTYAKRAARLLVGGARPTILICMSVLMGCESRTQTEPKPAGPLTLLKVGPAEGKVELTATQPIPRIEFAFSGAPGYVKQTVEITGTAESKNAGAFLYDATFRARDVGRLTFELIPNPPDATEPSQAKVRLATASGGEDSNASYNPRLWFGPGKEATTLVLSVTEPSGEAPPKAGEEILLAEIIATPQGPEAKPIRLAWKVRFSDNPAAPRLKAKRVERP